MPFYPLIMHFQTSQTIVHHPQFPQTHKDEDDDDELHQQQPPRRPTRPRRRPLCGTKGHK